MGEPREPSDMFKVRGEAASIPPVDEIVLPPAEQRRQKQRRILIVAVSVVLAVLSAITVRHFWHARDVEQSVLAAGDSGRPSEIQTALDTLDSGEAVGIRARLMASGALTGALPLSDAEQAFEAVPADDAGAAAARFKAMIYLALAHGQPAEAQAAASSILSAAGAFGPETAYAKSLAATANGAAADAVAQAQAAVTARDVPRYRAQLAIALVLAGRGEDALALDLANHPALLSARARVLAHVRSSDTEAAAAACLADSTLNPSDRGWCFVARAEYFAFLGKRAEAEAAIAEALQNQPPGDQHFIWTAAHALSVVHAEDKLTTLLDGVDAALPSADPSQRAGVLARRALAAGDSTEALRLLSSVPGTAEAHLLVARAQLLAGQREAAAEALTAVEAPWTTAEKAALRCELAIAAEDGETAGTQARISLDALPAHPEYIQVNIAGLLAHDEVDAASEAAEAAVAASTGDVRPIAALADVKLHQEAWAEALTVLQDATALSPEDVTLQAKLGHAARLAGNVEVAVAANRKTLELAPAHPGALVDMLALSLDSGKAEDAVAFLARIDEAELPPTTELALLRVRTLVGSGAGHAAIRTVERLKRRRGLRGNAYLRFAIAQLLVQAAVYPRAVAMYDQARVLGYDPVDTSLGRAIAWALDGRTDRANESMREALDAARLEGAEEGSPSPAANDPRILVVRGRIEANLGRFTNAQGYVERAMQTETDMAEAHMLLADIAGRLRQDPTEHLRRAGSLMNPSPRAWWVLARRLGPNEEGCGLARRYIRAAPRAEAASDVRDFIERCD